MNNTSPKLSFWCYLWVAPTSLLGLFIALITASFKMSIIDGVIEVEAYRTIKMLRYILKIIGLDSMTPVAFTLGHVIFFTDSSTARYWRLHERVHVRQNERWGIVWLPAYILASIWVWSKGKDPYYDNFFEIEAYSIGPE